MKINGISEFIITTIVVLFVASIPTTVETFVSLSHFDSAVCETSETCLPDEMCVNRKCVEVCTLNEGFVTDNAICSAYEHIPHWNCPVGYTGSPATECSKPCTDESDCAETDICVRRKCVPGCSIIQCHPAASCRTQDHKVHCYP